MQLIEKPGITLQSKFKNIYNEYYNYFLENNGIDISPLLPNHNFTLMKSQNNKVNIIDFFIGMSEKINLCFNDDLIKKNGQYFTLDKDVIDLILGNIMDFNCKDLITKKMLEPSCGIGIFITTIIYNLHQSKIHSKEEIIEFINKYIYGFEITEELIFFTKLNIQCLMVHLYEDLSIVDKIRPMVYLTDATYKTEANEKISLFDSSVEFIETNEAKRVKEDIKFHYIFGNPPYVTLYGRRDNGKSESLREYYINNYKFVPDYVKNGKFNITMFFFEQSLDWLVDDGSLSFIIDISFFEQAYKYLRSYILENSKVKYLITDLMAFKVGSGQIIITLQKSNNLIENKENMVTVINHSSLKKQLIKQDKWFMEEENKFLIIEEGIEGILKKIEAKSKPLDYYFKGKSLRTCCMLLNMENQFTSEVRIESENEIMPYYEGSKSLKEPFGDLEFTKYFEYNKPLQDKINDKLKEELTLQGIKNKKRIGLGQLDIYKSPKLFIRQSAKRIIASISLETAAANNSLYCLSEGKNDVESIKKLKIALAFLNSSILTFYALSKRIIRISKGKQPQIKTGDLKSIPLAYDDDILCDELLKIVDSIINSQEKNEEGIKNIDNLLYAFFDIDDSERMMIESTISQY
jgi:hypothetical protein